LIGGSYVEKSSKFVRVSLGDPVRHRLCSRPRRASKRSEPLQFRHTNVVAVLIPPATVRCSEVEVCWKAASNRVYQVQYRSSLTTNIWSNLGPPITGGGATACITNKVLAGESQRFFRVVPLP